MQDRNNRHRDEVFSKSMKAGKRTYFFDVKSTRAQDYFVTITESKKRMGDDGSPFYEKHKIFLYREDFDKFTEVMSEIVRQVNELREQNPPQENPYYENRTPDNQEKEGEGKSHGPSFTDINFEDLGN